MNLVTQFLTDRRDRLLMRLGCWLVIFSLVIGLMLPQQKADALVTELAIGSVAALAASYLCACGLPLVTQGMDRDALVSYVQRLIQEFLDTELDGISIHDWLGNVWDLTVMAGKLLLGRPLTEEFVSFAQWVAGKYGVQAGENVIACDMGLLLDIDGSSKRFSFTSYSKSSSEGIQIVSLGTVISIGDSSSSPIIMTVPGTNKQFRTYWDGLNFGLTLYSGSSLIESMFFSSQDASILRYDPDTFTFTINDIGELVVGAYDRRWNVYFFNFSVAFDVSFDESLLFIDRAESMSYIPEGIEAEQGIALDVGAAATMDLDMVLQGVLDDVLAGTLTSTMEAAGEEVLDPPAEELPDVDELGLPALGAALTSRFPFSIPWDFFRAVKLVAAPAKAPRFEVDFMAPIEHRVGQWQGDTTIVLDFSEYAIIGQISRWTSTIGFCLMLAGATKRLIWTA